MENQERKITQEEVQRADNNAFEQMVIEEQEKALQIAKELIVEFFAFVPESEELEEMYWTLLSDCLSNPTVGHKDPEEIGRIMFVYERTTKLINGLRRPFLILEGLSVGHFVEH